MRIVKAIVAFLLGLILIASTALAFGSYAVSEAISDKAVEQAITKSDAVERLTDNIIRGSTTNLGGKYGEEMQAVLKSEAMTAFFTEYTTRCLQNQVYGTQMQELGAGDLNQAFSRGMDECIENGSISMSEGQRLLFDTALNLAMPNLTKGINYVLSQMSLTDFVDENTSEQVRMARTITSDPVWYGSIGIAIMAALLLVVLYWRSKIGFMWCGAIVLVIAAFCYIFSMMIDQTLSASGTSVVLSKEMLYIMVSCGLTEAMRKAAILGAALMVAFPVFKIIFRRRRKN